MSENIISEPKNTIRKLTPEELEAVAGGDWIENFVRHILFRDVLPYKLPAVAGQRC